MLTRATVANRIERVGRKWQRTQSAVRAFAACVADTESCSTLARGVSAQ